ncbi:XdhC family protein [Sphingomonas ginkgonis]|uniref:XdhC family protein n=1 Tax=Sphingomonas ginkgonis TaxID=2315330 RepID=A0A429VBB4_9SPHN|nr:XdhC family protein [Sphingomonas ginkgonis]RST31245.1 XdhC family protein [Sphingomonas ginkgonis]
MLARVEPSAERIRSGDAIRTWRFLAAADEPGVLVLLTGTTGSFPRRVGSQMAVAADGTTAGSLSSGCVEQAIVAEARAALDATAPRRVRFGQGSPFIDIRLPCGGGIDLLFLPDPDRALLRQATERLEARRPVALSVSNDGRLSLEDAGAEPGRLVVHHAPPLRLVVVGQGEEGLATARLARAQGLDYRLLSSDEWLLDAAAGEGLPAEPLDAPTALPELAADPWTAVVFLYHDHEWEAALIARALATPAFWVGAMGSRTTQATRLALLRDQGTDEAAIARLRGPIGLIPAAREPSTLALSVLGEIVGADAARR